MSTTKLVSNLDKLPEECRKDVTALIHQTVEQIATDYKQTITTGARSGRRYKGHTASAPGEPPASRSGELVKSVETNYPSDDLGEMKVGSYYGRMLEYGTKRIAARPALRPIMERIGPEYKKKLRRIIQQAAKRSGVT